MLDAVAKKKIQESELVAIIEDEAQLQLHRRYKQRWRKHF